MLAAIEPVFAPRITTAFPSGVIESNEFSAIARSMDDVVEFPTALFWIWNRSFPCSPRRVPNGGFATTLSGLNFEAS